MEPVVWADDVSFTYAGRRTATLRQVSFRIARGEFVLLTGASGCGKSTLLKMLNGLIPLESGGTFQGAVAVAGRDTRRSAVADLSQMVGMVFQSPDDQIFAATIGDEVAFALENMGLPAAETARRVALTLRAVGLEEKMNDSVHALSGGQKQRLAVASVLAARPAVLALDEPISQVDPANAARLLELLVRLNREDGVAVLLVEHRLHEVLDVCSRVMVMDAGQIVWDGPARAAVAAPQVFSRYGLRLPQAVDVCLRLGLAPTTDPAAAADSIRRLLPPAAGAPPPRTAAAAPPVLTLRGVRYAYESGADILRGVDLTVRRGEIVALMGTNGAGKSTLLQQIAGVLTPDAGAVVFSPEARGRGSVGFVMQNPDFMLFNRTVREEILFGPRQLRRPAAAENGRYTDIARRLALDGLAEEFPLGLSRGQRLRVAIAAVLALEPALLLLDEPTTGQDISRIDDILTTVRDYAARGGTVIFCTHDTEVAASFAHRILLMQDGRVIADGRAAAVCGDAAALARVGLRQPPAMRIAALLGWPGLVSVEEVAARVGQTIAGCRAG